MIERKSNNSALVVAFLGILAGWLFPSYFYIPIILGIIAIIIAVAMRKKYFVTLPISLSIAAIAMGIYDILLVYTNLFPTQGHL
ncbi:MAG: hypothetical protein IKV85_05125 [Ruminococcus sp.]|nr:hypothetical protein [Ruminococcus sp.]